jgi:hypothetical protein
MKPRCIALVAAIVFARTAMAHAETTFVRLSSASARFDATNPIPVGPLSCTFETGSGANSAADSFNQLVRVIVGFLVPEQAAVGSRSAIGPSLRIRPARIANEGYGVSASFVF